MSRYKRITLYYNMEDSQDGLRYALINSLAARKKNLFDKMLDNYLETYDISNIEDLTLKDLQEISKMLMGKEEVKEKRGRGRPRKAVDSINNENSNIEKELDKQKETLADKNPETGLELKKASVDQSTINYPKDKEDDDIEEEREEVHVQQPIKAKNPMSFSIDDDEDEEGSVDPALLGELDAFNL